MDVLQGVVLFLTSLSSNYLLSLLIRDLLLAPRFPHVPRLDLSYAANWSVSFLQAILSTVVGSVGAYTANLDLMEYRLPFLVVYGWINLGYWVYDFLALFFLANEDVKPVENVWSRMVTFVCWWPGIVFHHIGIIIFLYMGILNTERLRGDGVIALAQIMELSSIFVAARSGLARLGLKHTQTYFIVSLLMVVSFMVARILLVPCIIWLYCSQQDLDLLGGISTMPIKCRVGTIAFYGLNLHWFFLMLRGAIKLYMKGRDQRKNKKD